MRFSSEEVELLLHIARDASLGSCFLDRIEGILEALSALVPNTSFSAFVADEQGGSPPAPQHLVFRNRDPAALVDYAQHYVHIDPMGVAFPEGKGRPVLLSDFAAGRRFGKDAFTGDFMPGLGIRHIMAIGHRMAGGSMFALALHREPGLRDFTTHERELMRIASPDIGRAIQSLLVHEQVSRLKSQLPDAQSGALVFDRSAELIHADAGAVALSSRLSGSAVPGDLLLREVRRLTAVPRPDASTLERIYSAMDGGWVRARYSLATRGKQQLVVVVLEAVRQETPLLGADPGFAARLTPRELEVAKLAVQGLGNRQIGLQLGMSAVTVGVHLTQIYRKTGASGRNELTTMFLAARNESRSGR